MRTRTYTNSTINTHLSWLFPTGAQDTDESPPPVNKDPRLD